MTRILILSFVGLAFLSACGADGAPESKRDPGVTVGGDAYIGIKG